MGTAAPAAQGPLHQARAFRLQEPAAQQEPRAVVALMAMEAQEDLAAAAVLSKDVVAPVELAKATALAHQQQQPLESMEDQESLCFHIRKCGYLSDSRALNPVIA